MVTQLLRITEVSSQTGRCRASIYADIKKGCFPPPVKIGPRSSRWRSDDITDWINQLPIATFAAQSTTKN